jgi:xylulose-5-phosphate/fructose-6-phosphate phosphoketolase
MAQPARERWALAQVVALTDFRDYAVVTEQPGSVEVGPTQLLGQFLRDIARDKPAQFPRLQPG